MKITVDELLTEVAELEAKIRRLSTEGEYLKNKFGANVRYDKVHEQFIVPDLPITDVEVVFPNLDKVSAGDRECGPIIVRLLHQLEIGETPTIIMVEERKIGAWCENPDYRDVLIDEHKSETYLGLQPDDHFFLFDVAGDLVEATELSKLPKLIAKVYRRIEEKRKEVSVQSWIAEMEDEIDLTPERPLG